MLTTSFNPQKDIWLNVYMTLGKFKNYWIHDNRLVLPFTPLHVMKDSREGWGKTSLAYREVLKIVSESTSRAIEEGFEIVGCHSCTIKSLYGLSLEKNPIPSLNDLIGTFKTYEHLMSSAHIRCFFMTNTIQEAIESRYMWDLYGSLNNKDSKSLLLSVNWNSLISTLEKAQFEIHAEPIDYENDTNRLFYKDNSYKHEREFRIATHLENDKKIFTEILKSCEIEITISEFDRDHEVFFQSLGFTSTRPFNSWRIKELKLDSETGHNYNKVLPSSIKLLEGIDPERWNKVMGL